MQAQSMVQSRSTFQGFVSCTFDDLKSERNALWYEVFPMLGCR